MTLIAVWYRKSKNDICAIADSRVSSVLGTLTDQAPKFTIANIQCYKQNTRGHFEQRALHRQIAIGFAGSSAVAFATIATIQAYLAELTLDRGETPRMSDVADLARRILDQNFRAFGSLWQTDARCDLTIFGFLPSDVGLKCFHVSSNVVEGKIKTDSHELSLVSDELCYAFGSCDTYYMQRLKEDMKATGNFHPFNMLERLLCEGGRSDIGGYIQVAIASREGVILPHVIKPRKERGEYAADVSFLGREIGEIGKVGDCSIGRTAVGPDFPHPL